MLIFPEGIHGVTGVCDGACVCVCVYGTGKMQREILLYVVRMIQH